MLSFIQPRSLSRAKSDEQYVTISVNSKTKGDYSIVCAFYNNHGILISTETKTVTLDGKEGTMVSFDKVSDYHKAYIYSWDEKTLTPLSRKCAIN